MYWAFYKQTKEPVSYNQIFCFTDILTIAFILSVAIPSLSPLVECLVDALWNQRIPYSDLLNCHATTPCLWIVVRWLLLIRHAPQTTSKRLLPASLSIDKHNNLQHIHYSRYEENKKCDNGVAPAANQALFYAKLPLQSYRCFQPFHQPVAGAIAYQAKRPQWLRLSDSPY